LKKNIIYKLKKIFFYSKYRIYEGIRFILKIDQKIYIGKYKLILPPKHLFTLYKKIYKNYDTSLVQLTSKLKKDSDVLDIGSNVGDSLFQMINSNRHLNYYCIEGDKLFFSYLKKNIKIFNGYIQRKIFLINKIVGLNLSGNLVGNTSTKKLVLNQKGKKSKKLDEIISTYKIKNLKLIKIDVDSFDYNVINSGMKNIKKFKPLIYFEVMITDNNNLQNYKKTITQLDKIGYKFWTLIDNYGNKKFTNKQTNYLINFIVSSGPSSLNDVVCYTKKIIF
jgi:FkbM family methyltransferase